MKDQQKSYMQRCLELAACGQGRVEPNPMVGCVIVHNNQIIGEGYHREYGGPHAEVMAIGSIRHRELLPYSTLYVNLEPCSHHGKTPPCADLIIHEKIKKVIVGCRDPFPEVSGKGIAKLRAAGIEVIENVLEDSCLRFNKRFITFYEKQRPYITLKWARTADGFIDRVRQGNRKGINWITGKETAAFVHLQRSHEMAILVGSNTIINDDPQLTVRHVTGRNPVRIVLDMNARIPSNAAVFGVEAPTIVFTSRQRDLPAHVKQVVLQNGNDILGDVMRHLYNMRITSVLVEGGLHTIQSFIDTSLWDEATEFVGPVQFGDGLRAPEWHMEAEFVQQFGDDQMKLYFRKT